MFTNENYLLMKKSKEIEDLARKLGFSKTFFLDSDFTLVSGKNKNELLKKIKLAKKKKLLTLYQAENEEMLRFALEKTPLDIVLGMEKINPKDSVHFVRGGLDQVTCKIAVEKDKVIAFSFADILNAQDRKKIVARMKLNLKLCRKYKVKVLFSNFSTSKLEMRSAQDLASVFRILG